MRLRQHVKGIEGLCCFLNINRGFRLLPDIYRGFGEHPKGMKDLVCFLNIFIGF